MSTSDEEIRRIMSDPSYEMAEAVRRSTPNSQALAKLLAESRFGEGAVEATWKHHLPQAEFLASRGVLVPSVVTPDQVKRMDPGINCINGESGLAQTDCCEECATAWRAALERIARNEPEPSNA